MSSFYRSAKRQRISSGSARYAAGPYVRSKRRMASKAKGLVSKAPRGIYRFVRCTSTACTIASKLTFSVTQGTVTTGNLDFLLLYLPGYTDFTNLFDVYRVTNLQMFARSNWDSADVAVGTSTHLDAANIFLHTVVDTNDDTPITIDQMRQYPSYKMTRITDLNGFAGKQSFRPQISLQTDGSAGVSVNPKDQWISTASPDTTHYGIKWAISRPAGSRPIVDMTIDIYYRAVVECKNVN